MSAFSPRQMFALDLACQPIEAAFNETPYLVGTAATRQTYRDVDVRVMLDDDRYAQLAASLGENGIAFLSIAIGSYLASASGLPIDFQIQQLTAANANHDGIRNPLGGRTLRSFGGDGVPLTAPDTTPEPEDKT